MADELGNLGDLVVSFTSDLSDLDKGMKQAVDTVNKAANNIGDATKKAGLAMTAMGAAIVGAFALMVKSSTEYAEEILVTSQRTGIAVETLSQLKYAAEQSNVSFDSLANGLKFLNRNIYDAEQGNAKLKIAFGDLNINVRNSNGSLKDANTVLGELADRFSTLPDGPQKSALAMQLMGRAGTSLLPLLNQGSAAIQQMKERANDLGLTLTDKEAVAFKEFNDHTKDLKDSFVGLSKQLSESVLPLFDKIVTSIVPVIVAMTKWEQQNPELATAINQSILVFGGFVFILGTVALAVGTLIKLWPLFQSGLIALHSTFLTFAAEVAAFILSPIGAIIIIVGALATAWVANWGGVRDFFRTAAQDIGNIMDWIYEKAVFTELFLQDLGENIKKNWQHPIDAVKNSINEANQAVEALKAQEGGKLSDIGGNFASGMDTAGKAVDDFLAKMKGLFTVSESVNQQMSELGTKTQQGAGAAQTSLQQLYNKVKELQNSKSQIDQFAQGIVTLGTNMQGAFSTALSSLILHGGSAKQIIQQLGQSLVQMIVDFVAEQIIAATIGKALQAAELAVIGTIAAAMGEAWAIPAMFASIATLGGAVGIGEGAMASSVPFAMGLAAVGGKFAEGTDTVPSMLSPGEMVIPGTFADAIRKGKLTLGGGIGGSNDNSQQHIEVNLTAVINQELDIEAVAKEIAFRTSRELRFIRRA